MKINIKLQALADKFAKIVSEHDDLKNIKNVNSKLISYYRYAALINASPTAWAINSLVSLAEDLEKSNQDIDIEVFATTLALFINKKLTYDEVNEWINKNSFILNLDIIKKYGWHTKSDKYSSFLETYYDDIDNNSYYYRIYPDKLSEGQLLNLDVKQSSLLQGHKKIPNLYFYLVRSLRNYNLYDTLDKSYFKYFFLIQASPFNTLNLSNDTASQKALNNFFKENKSTLDKMLSLSTVSVPKYLGAGADGTAFDIGNNFVLKIFLSNTAYQQAKSAMERLHSNPDLAKTEAMIYDVGVLDFENIKIYYYIIEKMKTALDLPADEVNSIAKIIHKVVLFIHSNKDKWKDLRKSVTDKSQLDFLKKEISNSVNNVVDSINSSLSKDIENLNSKLELKPTWLPSLVEEIIIKYLTGRTDLHMGNLGITNYGELRYFDPSFSQYADEINYTHFQHENVTI